MKKLLKIILLITLLTAPVFTTTETAEGKNLVIHRVQPPIPPTGYVTIYNENAQGLEKYSAMVNGQKRSFYLYAPQSMRQGSPDPASAIILLHGSGRTGVSMAENWKNSADRHGIILVAPDALGDRIDYATDKPFVEALINFLKKDRRFAPDRIYLFGHSSGAIAALPMAAALSEKLNAASVHAGMLLEKDHLKIIQTATTKVPVCLINGSEDKSIPPVRARYAAQVFTDAGFNTVYVELTGHNHWYYTLADWINEMAWKCMTTATPQH